MFRLHGVFWLRKTSCTVRGNTYMRLVVSILVHDEEIKKGITDKEFFRRDCIRNFFLFKVERNFNKLPFVKLTWPCFPFHPGSSYEDVPLLLVRTTCGTRICNAGTYPSQFDPLRTHPHTYHHRTSPSCVHLHLYVKGSVLFSHRDTVKPWRKSLRILCHTFICKIYGLVLSTGLQDELICIYRYT
jgi:hypothetical protein